VSLTLSQDLFGQACVTCPDGATDSAVAVAVAAFRINPDGSTGAAIGGGFVGVCSVIRLRMSVAYTTPGPSGGTTVAFSGGQMIIKTASGSFRQDVTPAGGVPKIAPASEIGSSGCAQGGTNFFVSNFIADFNVSTHLADIVNGQIGFQALYGPDGIVAYSCPP